MHTCDICYEQCGGEGCKLCTWGNPCLGCVDYDLIKDECKSNGGCAE